MNHWSKWLDFWLQKLKYFIPTFVKDGNQVLDEVQSCQLPICALLSVTDTDAMYNNIDMEHAILDITWWLGDLHEKRELLANFPLDAILSTMATIMRDKMFEFGDCYFLQLLGTAMGTSTALMLATLYYAYHKVHTIIPNHDHNLFYIKQFIDDIFGIWTGNLTTDWVAFSKEIDNFGILTWDIIEFEPSTSINFLDMTQMIDSQRILPQIYLKETNMHIYIPPMFGLS